MASSETMKLDSEPQRLSSLLQDTLNNFVAAIHDQRLQSHKTQCKITTGVWPMLTFMKNTLHHAWVQKSNDTSGLLLVLAVASRDQRLRPLFGGYLDQNPQPEDSILAYVLDPIIQDHGRKDDPKVLENALRLISNCVADTHCVRKLALQKNTIENVLRLARDRRSIDFVIPALYNLCVEYDDPDSMADAETSTAARANLAQIKLAHSHTENGTIRALFEMADGIGVDQGDRIPLLAALIEMASLTAPEDLLCMDVLPGMDALARRRAIYSTLLTFLGVWSVPLTSQDGNSTVSVCNALLNVLAAPEVKQVLVSERQLQSLASFSHIIHTHVQGLLGHDDDDDDTAETLASLQQCDKALLQEFYTLSGLPEFNAAYTVEAGAPGSDFIQVCIERPRKSKFWAYSPVPTDPSIAIAYTVLANITTSEATALKLVETYQVHKPLQAILRDLDDVDGLYPALGFLSRLALPIANKQEIVNCGMLEALQRFCRIPGGDTGTEWKPALCVEALTAIRRLISGQPEILACLHQDSDLGWYPQDILDFFKVCNDTSTKIEIGRLFVEHFRTVSSSSDQRDPMLKLYDRIINQSNFAEPIAFLACEGQNPGAKAEGWFGLGLMTFWEKTRVQVLEAMKIPRVVEEVEKVADAVASPDRASADNLKLVLSRLDLEQCTIDVDRHAREVFASAKQKLGLEEIAT